MSEPNSADNADKAFELLVVIISLIFSIMRSYSGLFWGDSAELSGDIQAMRFTVIPIIILTLLWLTCRLTLNQNMQIFFRGVSWMTAFSWSITLLLSYFDSVRLNRCDQLCSKFLLGSIVSVNPLIVYFFIFPKYREKYSDTSFFNGYLGSIVCYLVYLVVMGVIIWLSTTTWVAW